MPVRLNSLNYRKNMLKVELKFLILFKNHKHKFKLFKSIKYKLKHTLRKNLGQNALLILMIIFLFKNILFQFRIY